MREHDPNYVVIPGRRGPGLGAVIVVSALTAAVVSTGTVLALTSGGGLKSLEGFFGPVSAQQGGEVRVPDIVGIAADSADEILSARKLRFVVKGRQTHASMAAGGVIEQHPLAQSRVQPGAEVSVVLSTGPDRLKVPDVVGKPLEEAQRTLETVGLRPGSVMEVDEGEAGNVTAVSPPPGAEVERGAVIALSVARPKVAVPNLRGEHIRDARQRIERAGLEVGDVSEIYDARKKGDRVLTQDPESGTAVPLGTKINVVINQGD